MNKPEMNPPRSKLRGITKRSFAPISVGGIHPNRPKGRGILPSPLKLENAIYHEDNLKLLDMMPDSCVDLIYSDVLYGTGRNFGDYQDLRSDNLPAFRAFYHFMLMETRRVLKDTGTLFIQTGTETNHHIRLLLEDVFGRANFRNEIIWNYNSAPRKKKDFGNRHDVIYRFTKTDNYTFNPIREPYSLSAPRGYEKEKYYHPEGKVIGDVWNIKILGQNDKTERVGYATQKPLELAKRIILSSTNPGELVADFFMGSGTTCVAAKSLNRNYLGCDTSEKALKIAQERLDKIKPKIVKSKW